MDCDNLREFGNIMSARASSVHKMSTVRRGSSPIGQGRRLFDLNFSIKSELPPPLKGVMKCRPDETMTSPGRTLYFELVSLRLRKLKAQQKGADNICDKSQLVPSGHCEFGGGHTSLFQ